MITKAHKPTRTLVLLVMLTGLLISACGTFEVNITIPASPTALPVDEADQLLETSIITQIVTPQPIQDQPTAIPPTPTAVAQSNEVVDGKQPNPEPAGSQLWVEVDDPRTGVSFAIPCFWFTNIPSGDQDPSGLGSFTIQNFTEEFVNRFGPKQGDLIWENGAIKIDMVYFKGADWGLPPDASVLDFAQGLRRGEGEGIESIEEVMINNQVGLLVTTYNSIQDMTNQSYYFALPDNLFLIFGVVPNREIYQADVLGILNSLALTSEVNVRKSDFITREPLEGMPADCLMGQVRPNDQPDFINPDICQNAGARSPEALACAIKNALQARDMASLKSLMTNPFTIGYWQSEGRIGTPAEITEELDQYHLPADTRGLTFTVDRSQFPDLYGISPEDMFGPDLNVVLVVYSTGWGQEGLGEALLLIAENVNGEYYWHSMISATQGF